MQRSNQKDSYANGAGARAGQWATAYRKRKIQLLPQMRGKNGKPDADVQGGMTMEHKCLDCGALFVGTPKARYCQKCRKIRMGAGARVSAKERGLCYLGAHARWREQKEDRKK